MARAHQHGDAAGARALLQELEEEVGDEDAQGGVEEKIEEVDGALFWLGCFGWFLF